MSRLSALRPARWFPSGAFVFVATRLSVALVAAAALAVGPGQGLSEPPRDSGAADSALPPAVNAPSDSRLEGLQAPGASEDSLVSYASETTATGIPSRALEAYITAEKALGKTDPNCGLRWELLAAIGRVESDHGRFAGRTLLSDGTSSSPIVGVPLDGGPGIARIMDTDDGKLDDDTVYDRAVGPMQFLPSTWDRLASDGDGDGTRNPHDLDDAALAAGRYLCAYGPLDTEAAMRAAVLHYNPSTAYADLVLQIMDLYARGLGDQLPSVGSVPSTAPAPQPPLPPATLAPPPAASHAGAGRSGDGTAGGRSGGGSGGTGGTGGSPDGGAGTGGSDSGGSDSGGSGSGGDSGSSGGGSVGGDPTPAPTSDPSPSPSDEPSPSPSPCPSDSPSPSPSPTPSDGTSGSECSSGSTTDPSPSPSPSP